jgi:CRP/FNR family transcriptional regulator, cyclic AMP receptor protein
VDTVPHTEQDQDSVSLLARTSEDESANFRRLDRSFQAGGRAEHRPPWQRHRKRRLRLTLVLHRNEKVELIKRAPLFWNCSKRELQQIAQLADEIDLREGKEMTRQGERGREFFVLLEGEADVVKDGHSINQLGAGDFFGEIALVADTPRTATVTASSPVRALVITDRSFRRLLRDQPEIQSKVLAALAARLAPESL